MMQEKNVKAKIRKIVESISVCDEARKKVEQQRDQLFAEILSELDQDYDKLVALVRTAKYEMIFQELLNNNEDNQSKNSV